VPPLVFVLLVLVRAGKQTHKLALETLTAISF
jgi:hypothetical protein